MVINTYKFSHEELTTLALKSAGNHEGHWTLELATKIGLSNLSVDDSPHYPTMILQITGYVLQRHEAPLPHSLDASVVNPVVEEENWILDEVKL